MQLIKPYIYYCNKWPEESFVPMKVFSSEIQDIHSNTPWARGIKDGALKSYCGMAYCVDPPDIKNSILYYIR